MELKTAMWLIIIWIALVIVFMAFLLKKYTFGDWDSDHKNPYEGETLGLPRGVFRGILTLSVLFVVLILQVSTLYVHPIDFNILAGLFKNSTLNSNQSLESILGKLLIPEERFAQMMVAFQMVIAFYFGGKVMHHVTQAERRVSEKRSDEAVQTAKIASNKNPDDEEAVG